MRENVTKSNSGQKYYKSKNWKRVLATFINFFTLIFCPNYGWGIRLRGALYSPLLKSCGKNLKIAANVHIYNPDRLTVGDNVYIGFNSYIGDGDITLEDEVVIGPFCSITGGNHRFANGSVRFGGYEYKPLLIGKGTWIAAHVCILAGVTIGKGNLICAGAVVTKSTKDSVIIGGVPAVELKTVE